MDIPEKIASRKTEAAEVEALVRIGKSCIRAMHGLGLRNEAQTLGKVAGDIGPSSDHYQEAGAIEPVAAVSLESFRGVAAPDSKIVAKSEAARMEQFPVHEAIDSIDVAEPAAIFQPRRTLVQEDIADAEERSVPGSRIRIVTGSESDFDFTRKHVRLGVLAPVSD